MKSKSRERERGSPPAAGQAEPGVASWSLAVCLLSLSFSTVLFTLALFKLLSFFIMPSLFFDLLFIGFPLGASLGARFFGINAASFRKTLWVLLGTAVLSTAACLACKHFDYLRAHLFEVEVHKLLGQIGVFTGLFIPYFAGYGLSEYVGYQFGRERLRGRMRLVYALYLFGAAAAYLFLGWGLSRLGVAAMIALALAGVAMAAAILSRGGFRVAAGAAALGIAALGVLPALRGEGNPIEQRFLDLYKGTSLQSSRQIIAAEGAVPRFRRWGRYSYCEILWSPLETTMKGLYNDFFQWEYAPGSGFLERSLGAVPLWFVPPSGKAAIIGSGGGRQVRYAERLGLRNVLALEIEPAVIEAVRGPLAAEFDRVYEAKGVEVVVREARSFMEDSGERYDLIYLPSVGGYPQMMLEPGNMIRTFEAYRTLRDRLNPQGVLAIWYPAGLDMEKVLTDQYVRTLRSLGMETVAYEAVHRSSGIPEEFLILAVRTAGAYPAVLRQLPELEGSPEPVADFPGILEGFFVLPEGSSARTRGLLPYPDIAPRELPVQEDPLFTPVTDEKPFLAGNVSYIFSMDQVYLLFSSVGGILFAASAAVAILLRRRGDPGVPGHRYSNLAFLSVLIGANFLLAEHYLVLALFKNLFVYYDSLVRGAIAFLILSGLGSIAIAPRLRGPLQALAALSMLVLLAFHLELPALAGLEWKLGEAWVVALFAPVAFVTGSFFPAVFELAARNPLGVFAMDAIGAAFGSLAAFFLPIAFGFKGIFVAAGLLFLATTLAYAVVMRPRA